ncbi:response regulator [Myxococcota bacterium]|nr:response regulator [Myxococcota bacterium]MBU1382925.1 response regulator [Myxococcota bacterium]MBU1496920.1 response regulator [Myxococcota bacterium]
MAPRILFINKMSDQCNFLTVLEKRGYHILTACNGLKMIRHLEVERPDLIIMQTKSSWPNSFSLCTALRSGKYSSIPVFFLSENNDDDEQNQSISCGANKYFSLPNQMDHFLQSVREICGAPKFRS